MGALSGGAYGRAGVGGGGRVGWSGAGTVVVRCGVTGGASLAAVAVTLSARRKGQKKRTIGFGIITVVFVYTTVANVIERPDGVRIAAVFIIALVVVSLVSRWRLSFEPRASPLEPDGVSRPFVEAGTSD